MKSLHRPDLFAWSRFDEARNVDFSGTLWVREAGNVVIDPMPLSAHDRAHLDALGGAALIVVTNSDHLRAAVELAFPLAANGARSRKPKAHPRPLSATPMRETPAPLWTGPFWKATPMRW